MQFYDSNSGVKFPLADEHEADIPNHVLLDMSLTTTADVPVTLTNLVTTPKYAFCVFETADGEPVGHVMTTKPRPFRVYPLEMRSSGFGWVVFGAGVREELRVVDVAVPLAPGVATRTLGASPNWKLRINGVEHAMPAFLNVVGGGYASVGGRGGRLVVSRNDRGLTEDEIRTLFAEQAGDEGYIQTINYVGPDDNGGMTLEFDDSSGVVVGAVRVIRRSSDERAVGVIITPSGLVEGCAVIDVDDLLECSDEGGPLNIVVCPEEVCDSD